MTKRLRDAIETIKKLYALENIRGTNNPYIDELLSAYDAEQLGHGRTKYAYGYRCDICKKAARDSMRDYRARQK